MIQILLATFNGEKYLPEQLDSLFSQTNQDWTLLAHDDGSSDKTVLILKRYQNEFPTRIELIEDGVKTGSPKNNFAHLMAHSEADYVMFCDQDDVWLREKIETTLKRMKETEMNHPNKPVLVHTDLVIVDADLDVISPSMFLYQKLMQAPNINQLLVHNNVTGCTAMINRLALRISMPVPAEAVMHDWWLALRVITQDGHISLIRQPTVLYRQHESNSVGSKKINLRYYFNVRKNAKFHGDALRRVFRQAKCFTNASYMRLLLYKIRAVFTRLLPGS